MKTAPLQIISAIVLLSGTALADLEVLALPVTTPNQASVAIAAGEAVEIHAQTNAQGAANANYVVQYTYGGITYNFGGSNGTVRFVGDAFPGPGTLRISSNVTTSNGMIVYRIVPASDYAKNRTTSDKFMAAAQPERTGVISTKSSRANIADVFATDNSSTLAALKE